MIVTTPAESLLIVVLNGGPARCSSTSSDGANSAAWWNRPAKTMVSIMASNRILPFSRDRISVRSSASDSGVARPFGVLGRRGGRVADDRAGAGRVVDRERAGRAWPFLARDQQRRADRFFCRCYYCPPLSW